MSERVEECTNQWRDGTCPQCGEAHFIVVRRERFHNLATALAQAERERDEARAERERDEARAERNARARDVMHLEAEVERLRAQIVGPNADYEAWQRAERLREQAEASLAQAEREREEWRVKALGVTERLSEREEFIRQNVGLLLAERDSKIERQRRTLQHLTESQDGLKRHNTRLREARDEAQAEVERLKVQVALDVESIRTLDEDREKWFNRCEFELEPALARTRAELENAEWAIQEALHDLPDKGADAQATLRAALEGRG